MQQIHLRSRTIAAPAPDHRTAVIGILLSAVIAAALLQPVPIPSLTSLRHGDPGGSAVPGATGTGPEPAPDHLPTNRARPSEPGA